MRGVNPIHVSTSTAGRARQRLMVLSIIVGILFTIAGVRLLQVSTVWADGNDMTRLPLVEDVPRGDIVDRHGVLLATTLAQPSLYVDPFHVGDPEQLAEQLATIFPMFQKRELAGRLAGKGRHVLIRRHLRPSEMRQVVGLGHQALRFEDDNVRTYPKGSLAVHAVGYTDVDGSGQGGVERKRDSDLRRGEKVALTLDSRVQFAVREQLAHAIEQFRAVAGVSVVLDVRNGEILALVSLPDFDPNHSIDPTGAGLLNRASQGLYELGSTFKPITMASALDSGTTRLDSYYDASKPIRIARRTIRDFHGQNRVLTAVETVVYSSNIGISKIARLLGPERMQDYLGELGLLGRLPIEGLESSFPLLPEKWGPVELATVSFGQGIAVTPVQLVAAFAAVVNGGHYHSPRLLRDIESGPSRRVFQASTSMAMRFVLRQVILEGSGGRADVEGYAVGGKTGTAQKPVNGVYKRGVRVTSFLATFPIDAPRYAVVVMLDEPKEGPDTHHFATAGWNAAPTAGAIIAAIAPLLGVPRVPAAPPGPLEAMHVVAVR